MTPESDAEPGDDLENLVGGLLDHPDESSQDAGESGDTRDPDQDELVTLIEGVYASGKRLGRIGDCVLLVSIDGMQAFFVGRPPEGTTFAAIMNLLEEAGISYGVKTTQIHDLLPKRRASRRTSRRETPTSDEATPIVIADAQPPAEPEPSQLKYHFAVPDSDSFRKVRKLLADYDLRGLKSCQLRLPIVRPQQLLAEVVESSGSSGRDVFGHVIEPDPPEQLPVPAGENVLVSDDGKSCTAATVGYVGVVDDEIVVIPPVFVSRDLLSVYFLLLPQEKKDGPHPSKEEVLEVLGNEDIVYGVDESAIEQLCEKLKRNSKVDAITLIARGNESGQGKDAEWKFLCEADLTRYHSEIRRICNDSPSHEYLLNYAAGLAGKAVQAGEPLAEKKAPVQGTMGTDVFGEEFMGKEPIDRKLEENESVRLAEDGSSCSAAFYGYLGISKRMDSVQIVPPIWISRDRMAVYFLNLPQLGTRRTPTPEEIDHLLGLYSVTHGIDRDAIMAYCKAAAEGVVPELAVLIAKGVEPRDGDDARFDGAVTTRRTAGFVRDDGSIDFKELNLAVLMEKGQRIGVLEPETTGTPGYDVTGRALKAGDGSGITVREGKNVLRVRSEDTPDEFCAEVAGELVVLRKERRGIETIRLGIFETKLIPGDVDYSTGNIEFPGNVTIEGSIKPGFKVKAEGNVVIGTSIESGAEVTASGNVAVQYGITGSQTRVSAAGSVYAMFVNAARVSTAEDLNISKYIYNASIRAEESIVGHGTRNQTSGGVIAGGIVLAGSQIRAHDIGSDSSSSTQLIAGVDGPLLKRLGQLQKLLDLYRSSITKTLRSLHAEKLAPEQIRHFLINMLLKAKGPMKKLIAKSTRNLLQVQARLEKAEKEKRSVEEELKKMSMDAAIDITGTVAENTVLRIGSGSMKIDASGATSVRVFLRNADDEELELAMEPI